MIDYASIGFKVRQARKKKGITQEQLAEAVGVGVTHILSGFAARRFFSLAFLFSSLTFSEHGQQTLAW